MTNPLGALLLCATATAFRSSARLVRPPRALVRSRLASSAATDETLEAWRIGAGGETRGWACMASCGACCHLGGRPHLDDILSPDERAAFDELLVGSVDGWCKHYSQETRGCGVYEDRPSFCRVDSTMFEERYGVPEDELDEFAADCCREHIEEIYGDESSEMDRFEATIAALADEPGTVVATAPGAPTETEVPRG